MNFTAFSKESGEYSYIDLYYYQSLNILALQKVKTLQKKKDIVREYMKTIQRVY